MGSPAAEQPGPEHNRFLIKSHATNKLFQPYTPALQERLNLVPSARDWQQASTTWLGLKTVGVNTACSDWA